MSISIVTGDCLSVLRTLPAGVAQACVTSPPYFGLRDYGVDGQIGLEDTPEAFVARLVEVFSEVRRVLRDDGTLWLNLGDSYCNTDKWGGGGNLGKNTVAPDGSVPSWAGRSKRQPIEGVKPKDLIGIPWRVAFALQADGWYLRQEIIWHKPNPMPESVRDRCTKAHEQVFLLSKRPRYYFDTQAIAEPATGQAPGNTKPTKGGREFESGESRHRTAAGLHNIGARDTRNRRSVWTIATQPFSGAHFATMPPELADACIKASTRPGDTVLDPFGGAGTTGLAADRLQREALLIELNPDYAAIARDRIAADAPLLGGVA